MHREDVIERYLRYVIVGGVFLIPFVPLIVTESIFFPFITGKNFFFRIVVEIMFAVWVLLAIYRPVYRPRKTVVLAAIGFFLIAVGAADIFGENPGKSFWSNFERMEGFVSMLHLSLYALVAGSVLRAERLWLRFFGVSAGVALTTSLIAILQYSGELSINQGGVRVDATLGNAIYLAGYLLLHIFVAGFLYVRGSLRGIGELAPIAYLTGLAGFGAYYLLLIADKSTRVQTVGAILFLLSFLGAVASLIWLRRRLRAIPEPSYVPTLVAFGFLVCLYTAVLFLTATRGAILALAAGVLVVAVFLAAHRGVTRGVRVAAVSMLAVSVLGVVTFFLIRDNPTIRAHKVFGRIASASFRNDDATARFRVWSIALKGFKERPILGWGQESFNFVFNKHYDPKLYGREQWFDRTHNIFLDWLVAAGIVGLLSYLSLLAAVLVVVWGRDRVSGERRMDTTTRAVLTGLIGAYIVHNLFVFDNVVSYLFLFSLLACLHSLSSPSQATAKSVSAVNTGAVFRLYAPMLLMLVGYVIYTWNVKPIYAGKLLIQSMVRQEEGVLENLRLMEQALILKTFANGEIRERLAQSAMLVAAARADADTLLRYHTVTDRELGRQIGEAPKDARPYFFMGMFQNAYGRFGNAAVYLRHAEELSPGKQTILFELGNSFLSAGDTANALQIFRRAFENDPNFPEARLYYAAVLILSGNEAAAEKLLTEGFGTPLGVYEPVIEAYRRRGKFNKIIEIFEHAVSFYTDRTDFRVRLARAYLDVGNRDAAVREVREAMARDAGFRLDGERLLKELGVQ